MAKVATFTLLVLCVLAAFWGMSDQPELSSPEPSEEGESLKLLYELTDAELGLLALPEGAGELSEDLVEPEPELEPETNLVVESEDIADLSLVQPALEPIIEPVVEPICMSAGELRNLGEINNLEIRLQEVGIETLRVTRIIEELGPYMVYIPPMSTESEARNIVALLRSDGLDSIIIRDPPYVNGVSLGVFRSDENSADLLARVRGLDYNARRRQMSSTAELHSLLLSGPELASMEENFWQEIRSDFGGIEVLQKSCEEVASASNFQ